MITKLLCIYLEKIAEVSRNMERQSCQILHKHSISSIKSPRVDLTSNIKYWICCGISVLLLTVIIIINTRHCNIITMSGVNWHCLGSSIEAIIAASTVPKSWHNNIEYRLFRHNVWVLFLSTANAIGLEIICGIYHRLLNKTKQVCSLCWKGLYYTQINRS